MFVVVLSKTACKIKSMNSKILLYSIGNFDISVSFQAEFKNRYKKVDMFIA